MLQFSRNPCLAHHNLLLCTCNNTEHLIHCGVKTGMSCQLEWTSWLVIWPIEYRVTCSMIANQWLQTINVGRWWIVCTTLAHMLTVGLISHGLWKRIVTLKTCLWINFKENDGGRLANDHDVCMVAPFACILNYLCMIDHNIPKCSALNPRALII